MGTKGYLRIYLLAVLCAALPGCAPAIRESKTSLADYVNLGIGGWLDETHPAVRIVDIQKAGEPGTRYAPSPATHDLWLRPGIYEATLECFRAQTDPFNIPIRKRASSPDSNGHFRFTIEFHGEFEENPYAKDAMPYQVDCATSVDGKPEFVVSPSPWLGI